MGTRLDLWLSRISHFTQLGLFILAILGMYFTVIPLYQNALLNEAVAKKESELKTLSAEIEQVYGVARVQAVDAFIFSAGAYCTGLLQPVAADFRARAEAYLKGESPPHISDEDEPMSSFIAKNSMLSCLDQQAERDQRLKILRQSDFAAFKTALLKAAETLDNARPTFGGMSYSERSSTALNFGESARAALLQVRQIQWPQLQEREDH